MATLCFIIWLSIFTICSLMYIELTQFSVEHCIRKVESKRAFNFYRNQTDRGTFVNNRDILTDVYLHNNEFLSRSISLVLHIERPFVMIICSVGLYFTTRTRLVACISTYVEMFCLVASIFFFQTSGASRDPASKSHIMLEDTCFIFFLTKLVTPSVPLSCIHWGTRTRHGL